MHKIQDRSVVHELLMQLCLTTEIYREKINTRKVKYQFRFSIIMKILGFITIKQIK